MKPALQPGGAVSTQTLEYCLRRNYNDGHLAISVWMMQHLFWTIVFLFALAVVATASGFQQDAPAPTGVPDARAPDASDAADGGRDGGDGREDDRPVYETIPVGTDTPRVPAEDNDTPRPTPSRPTFAIHVNLLSPLLFGATLSAEWGRRAAVEIRLRSLNVGFLPRKLTGYRSEFDWGLGGALGLRGYPSKKAVLSGFFLTALLEYYHANGSRPYYHWNVGFLVPQLGLGYRFVIGHFLLDLGGTAGFFAPVFERRHYWNGFDQHPDDASGALFIEGIVGIGWIAHSERNR